jgi:hypothetical protein
MTDNNFALRVLDVIARADLHDSLWWRTDGDYGPVSFWILCNDVFAWACADAERITPETLPELEQAIRDEVAITGTTIYADHLYCARRRGKRPQGAAYPDDRRLWPLFDACGPERPIGLGNPHLPGRVKPKTPAHDDLRRHIVAMHHNLAGLNLSDEEATEYHDEEHRKLWLHSADDLAWTDEALAEAAAALRELDGEEAS